MATFPMLKLASSLLFLISITSFYVQAAISIHKFVGDPCKTADREDGACTVLLECQVIVRKLKVERNYDRLVHCNFIGHSPVVCCPGKIPTSDGKKPTTAGSESGVIYQEDDEEEVIWDSTPTRPSTTTKPPPIGTKFRGGIGSKAESACENWHKGASPPVGFHILGGIPADPGEFPHMAGLGFTSTQAEFDYEFKCGGSLISNNFVLTAAHCVNRPDSRPVVVRLGKTTINSNEDFLDPVDIGISQFIIHNLYNSSRQYHDLALLRLERTVTFNDVIRPACLQVDTNDIGQDVELYATGWGKTDNATPSNILLKINLTYVPFNTCNAEYTNLAASTIRRIPDGLNEGQMCAHDYGLRKDTCGGDSGGPLQILSLTSQVSTIVGVVSFGIACASPVPGVYARVSYYMQWIESIVWP